MNDDVRLEQTIQRLLAETATSRAPDRLRLDIASATSRQRQRSPWLAALKEPPMRYRSRLAVGSPTLRLAAALAVAAALLLAITGAVLGGASLLPSPTVVTGVRNGLIAFDSNGDIMVANPDGSDPHALFTRPETDTSPVWSPDGTQLAFWADNADVAGTPRPRFLGIVDADGTNLRTYPPALGHTFVGYEGGEPGLDWGPGDGRLMIRTAQRTLDVLDIASGTWDTPSVGARQGMITGFDWSDDGRAVAFVTWDEYPHYEYVGIADPLGSDPTLPVRADPVEGSLVWTDWDPTSRYVAYNKALDDPRYDGGSSGRMQRDGGRIDVYTLDTRTGASTLVREGTFYGAIFSPDGSRLAFGDDQGRMWATDPDGSKVVDLGVTRGSVDMEWAPDGTLLATMGNLGPEPSEVLQMIIFRADGTGTPVAIEAPGNVGQPSWQVVPPTG
jgi:Tol biopolymer transport system component